MVAAAPRRRPGAVHRAPGPRRPRGAGEDPVGRTIEYALGRLDTRIGLADLAREAHLSPRSFTRHFRRATGTSPARWLLDQRVRASLQLLEASSLPVEHVGAAIGIPSPAAYRRHFARAMGVSPAAYRRAFRSSAPARAPALTGAVERSAE